MAVSEEEMVVRSRHFLVTEAELNRDATPQEIADFIRKRRVTGETRVHNREGGVRQTTVTQKTPLTEKEWEAAKKLVDTK